jgi:hypothetical protein
MPEDTIALLFPLKIIPNTTDRNLRVKTVCCEILKNYATTVFFIPAFYFFHIAGPNSF